MGDGEGRWWVVSLLIDGDASGFDAVNAEGLFRTTLFDNDDGATPITSTVARFADLPDSEQARWRDQLAREARDW
jgi:hypothetical protein